MDNYKIEPNFYLLEHTCSLLHDELLSSLDTFRQQVEVLNSTTIKLMQIEKEVIDGWTEAMQVLQHTVTVHTLSDDLDIGLQQLELTVAKLEREQNRSSNVNERTDERCKMYAIVLRLSTILGESCESFRSEHSAYVKDFEKVWKVYIFLAFMLSTFYISVSSAYKRAQCPHSYPDFPRTQYLNDGRCY